LAEFKGTVEKNQEINKTEAGTDAMIFKNIFAEKIAKNWRFLLKLQLVLANI
jgi:hypothetical protein